MDRTERAPKSDAQLAALIAICPLCSPGTPASSCRLGHMEPVTRSLGQAFSNVPDKAQCTWNGAEKGLCWLLLPGSWDWGSSGSRAQTAASGNAVFLASAPRGSAPPHHTWASCVKQGGHRAPDSSGGPERENARPLCPRVLCPDPRPHAPTSLASRATAHKGGGGTRACLGNLPHQ